jgi:aspartate kinase
MPTKGKLVVRFGGKSLLDVEHIRQAAKEVVDLIAQGWAVVVVVAAMKSISDQLKSLSSLVSEDPNLRELDMLLSSGDQVSAALMALALQSKGIQAMALTGLMAGIITDEQHGIATIRDIDSRVVEKLLKQDIVPVVTGSYGVSRQGQIATLGKGASDILAVSLAEAIHADRLEFLTDVDGIFSQDPNSDSQAKRIDFISYREMLLKAVDGASVVHPRALEFAMSRKISIVVRSSRSQGTLVASTAVCDKLIKLPVKPLAPQTANPDAAVA